MLKFLIFGMLAMSCSPNAASGQGVDYRAFGHANSLATPKSSQTLFAGDDLRSEDLPPEVSPLVRDFQAMARDPQHTAAPTNCPYEHYQPKGLKPEVEERRARYFPLVSSIACQVGLPVKLFDALVTQESGYNPLAISTKGAIGMAQLMPGTARSIGINPWNLTENLRGGAQILKSHLVEFGRFDLALAAYNAGAGRVRHAGRVPRIRETTIYVTSILSDLARQYARAIGLSGEQTSRTTPTRTASLVRF
jgi:soluble lytic murein transglycosylase-like protein